MRRRSVLGGLLATAAAGFPAPRALRAARPLVLGGTVSRSGRLAPFGRAVEKALVLWSERVNAAGGLSGRAVELALEDDASEPDAARRRFEALVDERADLLIAPYGSPMTRAVLPLIEAAGPPCLAPSAGDRGIWADPRDWLLQLLNPSDTMLHSAVDLAAEHGVASAAFLRRDDPFSRIVVGGAAERAKARGLQVVEDAAFEDAPGARTAIERLAARGVPDLVVAMGFTPGAEAGAFRADADMLLRLFREANVEPRLLCLGIGAAERDFPRAKPPEAVEGVLGSTGWRRYVPTPGNAAFVAAFEDRWSEAPDAHAAQGHAVGEVFASAWQRAAGGGPQPDAHALRAALFALDSETVFGRFRVNDRGLQVGKENAVVQWQAGAPVVVRPARYATGSLVLEG